LIIRYSRSTAITEIRAVNIAVLMTPDAEAEMQAYMDDDIEGYISLTSASTEPIDPATLRTTFDPRALISYYSRQHQIQGLLMGVYRYRSQVSGNVAQEGTTQ
jgi:hypothetical protein